MDEQILQTEITQETPMYTWELPEADDNATTQDYRHAILSIELFERHGDKQRTLEKYCSFEILGNEKVKGKKAKYDLLMFAIPIPASVV